MVVTRSRAKAKAELIHTNTSAKITTPRRPASQAQSLKVEFRNLQLEKFALEAKYNGYIRKQQEASFKQMENAQWLPVEETKIMSNLDRLKRDMRRWARKSSIKDILMLRSLREVESEALMRQLSNVIVLENGQLPKVIYTTTKSPILLLNALLTDHVYMSFFRSPFFFDGVNFEDSSAYGQPNGALEGIYQRVKSVNPQDAHVWRSQTLRLLMPPLRDNMSDGEKKLHHIMNEAIGRVAQEQAEAFLAGPASLLVKNSTESDVVHKLKNIYDEAVRQSYMLWTRRTEMRCSTLRDIQLPGFDAESPFFDPDNFMRHESHGDQMKDRAVTVLVHPMLKVAGTDEAKNYDQERVWVKGVVWLDSKVT